MTAAEMARVIGEKCTVRCEGFAIGMKVIDVKQAYGRLRVLVEPLNGTGQQWVDTDRVIAREG